MRYFRLILLLTAALSCSGYRWRCYIACDDQTAIQNDYVENRDSCREESQANLDEAMIKSGATDTPKARKLKLITLFSDCMGKYGWEVPVPGDKESKIAAEVPIYESTVSKIAAAKTAPPKDGLNPAATDPKVVDGETKQDQQTLERKVPPENVGKQTQTNEVRQQPATAARTANQQNAQQQPREQAAANSEQQKTTTNNNNVRTVNQKSAPPQQVAQEDQPKEVRQQPATTPRSATGTQSRNVQQAQAQPPEPQPNNMRQAQAQPKSQQMAQTETSSANTAANNSNVTRTLNQKASPSQQMAEQDQPKEMLRQPATTARAAKQPQPDNMQLAQLEPQAGPQTQPQSETNNSKITTNNNSRTVVQQPEAQQATQQEQPASNTKPRAQNRQNSSVQNRQAAPVTTVTPESPDQALTQSIQRHPAQTKIKYQNNTAKRSANSAGPTSIPQQPATTSYQQSEPRVAAVIDPANNQAPVTAITADSPDQALLESIHKKPARRVNRNSRTASQQGQTQAQTTSTPQGLTQAQSAGQPQQQVTQQQSTQQVRNHRSTAAAVAPVPVNNVNNARYNNTTNMPAANDNNASKIPSQPGVSKIHNSPRAAECEMARRNAATSPIDAQKAKDCELECAKIMKATPKIINPAPCPVKDAAVNVLDVQLGNKK